MTLRLLSPTLLLTLALGACAHERSAEPGYGWSYMDNAGEGLKLAYGRPNSDDVVMMLACAPGTSAVTLTATSLPGREIALASGRVVTRLPAQPLASDMSEGLLQARTSTDASALSAFRRTGDLTLLVADERHSLDAAPGDRAGVKTFFKACSAT
ncbi:hypothetical protein BH10PSE4_BH10PSE4_31120 [soil metagenome]